MENNDDLQGIEVESLKLMFEFFKHLTTLSSGSILLLFTLANDAFKHSKSTVFLFVAAIAFGISILIALFSMANISNVRKSNFSQQVDIRITRSLKKSATIFCIGMLFIIIAIVRQFGS
jgi:lysylphosphatidylglycerol synthetase-like protein (DUF2156 family)